MRQLPFLLQARRAALALAVVLAGGGNAAVAALAAVAVAPPVQATAVAASARSDATLTVAALSTPPPAHASMSAPPDDHQQMLRYRRFTAAAVGVAAGALLLALHLGWQLLRRRPADASPSPGRRPDPVPDHRAARPPRRRGVAIRPALGVTATLVVLALGLAAVQVERGPTAGDDATDASPVQVGPASVAVTTEAALSMATNTTASASTQAPALATPTPTATATPMTVPSPDVTMDAVTRRIERQGGLCQGIANQLRTFASRFGASHPSVADIVGKAERYGCLDDD